MAFSMISDTRLGWTTKPKLRKTCCEVVQSSQNKRTGEEEEEEEEESQK